LEAALALEVFGAVRAGVIDAMAEPGLAGMFFEESAFFCANIASRKDGLELIVLFERPRPGRGATSAFLGELGLFGSFCNSFCAVESRFSIILHNCKCIVRKIGSDVKTYVSALAGHTAANAQ
jgi:hypothetical protein